MKKATIDLIEKKFESDFNKISSNIRSNKREIARLSEQQRELKNTRKGLFEILRLIRGNK